MKKLSLLLSLLCSFVIATPALANNTDLTIYQVMQRVLDHYPSLKISEMEVKQAVEQRQEIESSLGWILDSSAGVTHDLTALGAPSDRLDITGSIGRQFESGSSLSLSGGYRYEDSTLPLTGFPNPAHTTKLDLSYRLPLAQGDGNPTYAEGIISSEAGYELAKANLLMTRITLAEQVKDLFYSSLLTQARISNAKKAVSLAQQLNDYIDKNIKLGLAEDKDKLQAKAQLDSKLADLNSIEIQWKQQQTSMNRLMLEEWNQPVRPKLIEFESHYDNVNELIKATEAYHPAVTISQAQLQIAESSINSARDGKKDNLDLVLSVGSRTSDGDSTTGTVSEKDWAGSVSVQYKHLFNDKGVSSKYKQALLQKNIALVNIVKTNDDIRYTVAGLVAEIEVAKLAVNTANQNLESEYLKLKEAEHRFRSGRADTAQLIQFINEYSFAELANQSQKIELNNRLVALKIFTGLFWNELASQHGVKR